VIFITAAQQLNELLNSRNDDLTTYGDVTIDQLSDDSHNEIIIDHRHQKAFTYIIIRSAVIVTSATVLVDEYRDDRPVIASSGSIIYARRNAIIEARYASYVNAADNAIIHAYDACVVRTDESILKQRNSVVIHQISKIPKVSAYGNTKISICPVDCPYLKKKKA
jgi:hypothetical protein